MERRMNVACEEGRVLAAQFDHGGAAGGVIGMIRAGGREKAVEGQAAGADEADFLCGQGGVALDFCDDVFDQVFDPLVHAVPRRDNRLQVMEQVVDSCPGTRSGWRGVHR